MTRSFHRLIHGLAAILFATSAAAGPFVAPAEENPPFRRDLLPIDTESMTVLSEDLTLLASGLSLATAGERRAAAQALALALALDPANSSARDSILAMTDGKEIPLPEKARTTRAKSRLWQLYAWLKTPEAGADGNLLAGMLGDVSSVLDPENPSSVELAKGEESGKWEEMVAPLSAFEEKVVVAAVEEDPAGETVPPTPEKTPAEENGIKVALENAELSTVLLTVNPETGVWTLGLVPVRMTASPESPTEEEGVSSPFEIFVPGGASTARSVGKVVVAPMRGALEKFQGALPDFGSIRILAGGSSGYSYLKNRDALTGPGFVLASAALSGRGTAGTVIARLDGEGNPAVPDFFWRMLSVLTEAEGGRLVVPKGAEEYLLTFLAMENPEFFLKYEVFIASDAGELVEFSSSEPSEKYAGAYAKFAEIREKSVGVPVGTYLVNRFVRQKFQEILDEAPHHFSARALALQGAGERPRTLERKILAAEIWRLVEPAGEFTLEALYTDPAKPAGLDDLYERIHAGMDRLDRYSDTRDRDLIGEAKNLATTIRPLARALRSREDEFGQRILDIREAYVPLITTHASLVKLLSEVSGDPLPGARRKETR